MTIELTALEGRWNFDRRITHDDGTLAHVTGSAVFHPDADGLIYDETGQISLNGSTPLSATRRYLWRPGLHVLFEDGRPFHTVPSPGEAAIHDCPPDTYVVRYEFADWPRWETRWQVTGPRKAYTMLTVYAPAL